MVEILLLYLQIFILFIMMWKLMIQKKLKILIAIAVLEELEIIKHYFDLLFDFIY